MIPVKVPSLGDSITEGTIQAVLKPKGAQVSRDEAMISIETDKITAEVPAPENGVVAEVKVSQGDVVNVGDVLCVIDTEGAVASSSPEPQPSKANEAPAKHAAPVADASSKPVSKPAADKPKPEQKAPLKVSKPTGERTERRVQMSRMRMKIAQRMKESQTTAASLTTFNEIDMTNLMALRAKYKDQFVEKHGIKLGFMSAFVRAAVAGLQELPAVNAIIDGNEIVYRDYIDISVAVATPTGLVVPVVRDCQNLSFADVEKTIAELGSKAKKNQLALEDMAGGTFTISNGGVYGSLMGTPIINQPQSAILGMHGIFDRPIALNGQVVIRPMMYVALTYDHRIIDGREAVTFLKKVKQVVENPETLLLEL